MSQNEAHRGGLIPHWVLEVPVYLVCGFLMSIGLGVSGMSNPINALGFFSVNSAKISWNPSLGFVFASALGTHAILFYIISALLSRPLLCNHFHQNTKHSLDWRLITGATLFGIGWSLGGFCPGPALLALNSGRITTVLFCVFMMAGLYFWKQIDNALNSAQAATKEKVEPPVSSGSSSSSSSNSVSSSISTATQRRNSASNKDEESRNKKSSSSSSSPSSSSSSKSSEAAVRTGILSNSWGHRVAMVLLMIWAYSMIKRAAYRHLHELEWSEGADWAEGIGAALGSTWDPITGVLRQSALQNVVGGTLIGSSIAILYLLTGKILGVSGIVGGIFCPTTKTPERIVRLAFVAGTFAAAELFLRVLPSAVAEAVERPNVFSVVGGFLVGLGTAMGNGCTSGHGICGVSRLSVRSICATATFMAAHLLGSIVINAYYFS